MFTHSHAYILSIHYILRYFWCLRLFWLFLSPSLSFVCVSLLLWHPNANLLHSGTLFISGHPLLLILHLFLSSSVMKRPNQTSLWTILDKAFILNAKSSYQNSPTLTFPLSSTVGNGSHCVTFWSPIHPCWSRSSTPTCMVWIFNTSFYYLRSRYTHCCHTGYCIRCAPCP